MKNNFPIYFAVFAIIAVAVFGISFEERNFGFFAGIRELSLSGTSAAVISSDVVILTNKKRIENKLQSLKYSVLLSQAAQMKADDMAKRGYFSHYDPDGSAPWIWFDKVGYKYSYAGENLALNFLESDGLIDAWMNSSLHKQNLLSGNYTDIGIGVASGMHDGEKAIYIVQFMSKSTF
jgi:uncharacterized protein YkwD